MDEQLKQAIEALCKAHGTTEARALVLRYVETIGPEYRKVLEAFPPDNIIHWPFRPRPSGPITGEAS